MRASPPAARLLVRRLRCAMSAAGASPAKAPRLADALRVKKLSEHATLPARGSAGAAGYDLARRAPHLRATAHSPRADSFPPCRPASPLQRARHGGARARQGAGEDGPEHRHPGGHIRPHRAALRPGLEKLHRHRRWGKSPSASCFYAQTPRLLALRLCRGHRRAPARTIRAKRAPSRSTPRRLSGPCFRVLLMRTLPTSR